MDCKCNCKCNCDADQLVVNAIRVISAEAVQKANSGHPGMPMGAAAMAYAVWGKQMKHNPSNPDWADRDRFVLSSGHGSMLEYSLLHFFGYGLSMEEIKNFRQFGSKTPGHPEYGHTVGVETTTGPLGQGIANGVGMALAETYLANKFNREGFPVVDHNGHLKGLLLLDEVRNIMFQPRLYKRFTVGQLMTSPYAILTDSMPMEKVMEIFEDTGAWNLPVVDTNRRYIGFVSKSKIFNSYRHVLVHFSEE